MLKKYKEVFNSLKYIGISGVSKGFNYILLLYFAVGVYSEQYVKILLLLSFEQILSLLLPLNQFNIIYSKSIINYRNITNKLITTTLIVTFIFAVSFVILKNLLYDYFQIEDFFVFISILISMVINSYIVYLVNYYKVVEDHQKALLLQCLLMISFLSVLLFLFLKFNILTSFFLGKAIGLIIVLFVVRILNLTKFKFKFKFLNFKEFKHILNLFILSLFGWISGLGFMNIAKINSSPEQMIKIGYALNLFNIFLLVSIGVNSIYGPIIKRQLINRQIGKALQVRTKTIMLYLTIALLSFGIYLVLNEFNFGVQINNLIDALPFATLIYVFNIFHWVSQPFYLINNKFSKATIINISSYLLWGILIIVCSVFDFTNYILFLLLLHMFKGFFLYIYAQRNLMRKNFFIPKKVK
jgi:hypothetical protein